MAQWSLIDRQLGKVWSRKRPAPNRTLDAVGEQAETVRLSIASMEARLDELKSLSTDFARLVRPMDDFLDRHPQLQARLAEVEAGLQRELELGRDLRRERDEAAAAALKATDEAAQSAAALARQQALARENDETITELRLALRSRSEAAEALRRKNDEESERSRALGDECGALRTQTLTQGQRVAQLEQRLAEAQAQAAMLARDNERLSRAVDDQVRRIGELTARRDELERLLADETARAGRLETGLADEASRRQRLELQREGEQSAASVEIAALTLKSEGLGSRLASTLQTLSETREQLRDKVERVQLAEQAASVAALDNTANARKVAAAQDEAQRALDALADLRATNAALAAKIETLEGAVGVKSAELEAAGAQAQVLADRVEQLKARNAEERAALEAANRRLENALQGERAERSLAQGALTIARESRARLQSEFASLRRRSEQEPHHAGDQAVATIAGLATASAAATPTAAAALAAADDPKSAAVEAQKRRIELTDAAT